MPIQVQLENDRVLRIDADPNDWKKAVERALEHDQVIEITNARGETLSINPHQIQYWAQTPSWEESATQGEPAAAAH